MQSGLAVCLALAFPICLISACGQDRYFRAEEERAGILFDWGTQPGRDGVESLVASCEERVQLDYSKGASVKFVDDANVHCAIPAHTRVAGCWLPDNDLIVLETAPRLEDTALCHELLHRQLFVLRRDPDYPHVSPEWGLLYSPTR
ncbi:hypothetical protein AKJ08_2798 [Vulgatibacter incomptus]|uniref:Uncharacterized protein n=1 Tax=Vulgatibacter incomptus TaxID=1391653 RepID=A0A0K1PG65_9BACT|nr:hypothetical protein AKJ08_2798 [Vulgatibacter incomptus]